MSRRRVAVSDRSACSDFASDRIAAATSEGKLLLFPVDELPQLARGKGVQTIKIHRTPIAPERVVIDGGRAGGRNARRACRESATRISSRPTWSTTSASARSAD